MLTTHVKAKIKGNLSHQFCMDTFSRIINVSMFCKEFFLQNCKICILFDHNVLQTENFANSKMIFQKIFSRITGHRPASVLKMSLFHRRFSKILSIKTNYQVYP